LYSGAALVTFGKSAQLLSDWSFYRISLALLIGVSSGVVHGDALPRFCDDASSGLGLPVAAQILISAGLFGLALTRYGWARTPGPVDLRAVAAIVTSTAFLGALLALIYIAARRSLTPVIFAHAVIDMIGEPGILLFAATGGFIR
jgi:hypothetical protein